MHASVRVRNCLGAGLPIFRRNMDCSRARAKDPSDWLETCPDFSKPLAEQIVDWFLTWEPDLTESLKWSNLCFSGRKLVVGLAACKAHLALYFFRGTELADPMRLFTPDGGKNTNVRSIRITSLDGLNREALRALLHDAVELDAHPGLPPVPKVKRKPWPMPAFFKQALAHKRHRAAADHFKKLAPTYQREYIVWLTIARRPETRARRLQEALAALAAGRKWDQRKFK